MSPRVAITRRAGVSAIATVATVIVAVAYLVEMHALIVDRSHPGWILALILAPWVISASTALARGHGANAAALGLVVALLVGGAWSTKDDLGAHVEALLYIENLLFVGSLALLFGYSLVGDRQPLVTRLARFVRRGDMPPAVVRYTRGATAAWAMFFAAEGAVSTALFFTQSREAWSMFVNLLQWPLVVAAFAVEYGIRLFVLRGIRHSSVLAGVRTFARRDDLPGDERAGDAR